MRKVFLAGTVLSVMELILSMFLKATGVSDPSAVVRFFILTTVLFGFPTALMHVRRETC